MIEPDRVLQPLRVEEGAIGRLETYGSPAELADALIAVRDAVDRALRLLLRSDAGAPDDVRLSALSAPDLPHDRLIEALRRRELISLSLAGAVHELERAAARAETVDVQAADADLGRRVVQGVIAEVRGGAESPVRESAHRIVESHAIEEPAHPIPVVSNGSGAKRAGLVALAAIAAVVIVVFGVRIGSRNSLVEDGVAAFRSGDFGSAEALFAEAVRADSGRVTALLYLGRIYRRDGRHAEAARALSAAEDRAPDDADVRRELGYLFMDLDRPEAAARQFDRARELDPDNELNWIGFIRALRAAGDPEAEVWLERAPPGVRAALTTTTP